MPTQTLSVTLDAQGNAQTGFTVSTPGKYCFSPVGGSPLIGIYQGTLPLGVQGKLRINPGTKRGVVTLASGPHLARWIGGTPGTAVSLTYRPWSFWDYFSWG